MAAESPEAPFPSPFLGGPRWWQWATVLSLDAPAVAVLWQREFARAAGISLAAPRPFVLGASVWLAYVADRWIEGWRLHPDRIRTQRHRFYQRHRWPVAVFWLAIFAADLAAAISGLTAREIVAGLVLLGCVLAYLLSHQLIHRHHPWRAPKELCVALLLGGGAGLFPALSPAARLGALAAPLGLFTLLCFANCALISVWENAVDRSHGQTSFALQFAGGTRFSRRLPWWMSAFAVAAWAACPAQAREAVACVGAGALLLGLVDRAEPRIGWRLARVLADVAVMTPLAPLVASWIRVR